MMTDDQSKKEADAPYASEREREIAAQVERILAAEKLSESIKVFNIVILK